MKFSGKICFKIILKVTKNQCITLSLEDTFFEKPPRGVEKFCIGNKWVKAPLKFAGSPSNTTGLETQPHYETPSKLWVNLAKND